MWSLIHLLYTLTANVTVMTESSLTLSTGSRTGEGTDYTHVDDPARESSERKERKRVSGKGKKAQQTEQLDVHFSGLFAQPRKGLFT